MFGRGKNRSVSLTIAGHKLHATTVSEFEAALSPLTEVSAQRLAELGSLDDDALNSGDQELARLIAQLSTSLHSDAEILESTKYIQTLGEVHLPWSEAFALASQWCDHQRPFRQSLLKAYVRYLSNEQNCLHTLQANRQRKQQDSNSDKNPSDGRRQRLIFNPSALGLNTGENDKLTLASLGKGNIAEVAFQPGQSMTLMFSRHVFLLVCGDPWLLIDSHGEDQRLQFGRNLVGRSQDCDVAVNERYFAVSRRHALLEIESSNVLKITDLSSLGTFIPHSEMGKHFH